MRESIEKEKEIVCNRPFSSPHDKNVGLKISLSLKPRADILSIGKDVSKVSLQIKSLVDTLATGDNISKS